MRWNNGLFVIAKSICNRIACCYVQLVNDLLGASLVYFVKEASQKIVCFALGSSAGIMVGASFFHLSYQLYNILKIVVN